MIVLFVICLVAVVAFLEMHWADWCLSKLRYRFSCDTTLAEPDQIITLTACVENRWFLPVMYIRLYEYMPLQATVHENADWMKENMRTSVTDKKYTGDTFYLLPRRKWTGTLRISIPRRGGYRLGEATLTAGDFLGVEDNTQRLKATTDVVVLPRRCEDADVLRTLGGFMGDISVRRFILEDPILTVGFREYTGREPMKSISWTQSARANRLLVKQHDYTVDATVTVLLNAEDGTEAQLEQCFSLTRSVCEELEKRGIPYDFRTNGDLIGPLGPLRRVNEGLGHQHLNTILYGLGRASFQCYSTLEKLVERSLRSTRPNQSYIVITPPLPPARDHLLNQLRAVSDGQVCVFTSNGSEEVVA